MEQAPLFDHIADGPQGGQAYWVHAEDGVRLRLAVWRGGAAGTVLLFPGRTEYAEKYGRGAAALARRGFTTVTIDWRGQGLSDRLLSERDRGHVDRFTEYQRDVAAMLAATESLALAGPRFLIAHSMGGAIGLRSMIEGMGVKSAVFSAPMWGIRIPLLLRPAAWALSAASRPLGFDGRFTPGTGGESYVAATPFETNELTTDAEMYAYMRRQLSTEPDLALAGPSLAWLHEALCDSRELARQPAPDVPAVTFLGSAEKIVCPCAIVQRMEQWPKGRLELVEGARHEVMMEGKTVRRRFYDAAASLFRATGGVMPPPPRRFTHSAVEAT
ncbi:lysophospholipase [Rhodovulum iodosum]|uniref:Lysophospholipase n=1 Tax=Rhodovulum iodosum TaxID=68291 RepID=A0ABV3XPF2_9RHOB|nr:alpha/beta hydrolase [Rhodovulum robiginosum]RSK31602.1 alpha/beta hydrolase [Rhodovulum robiginosum]